MKFESYSINDALGYLRWLSRADWLAKNLNFSYDAIQAIIFLKMYKLFQNRNRHEKKLNFYKQAIQETFLRIFSCSMKQIMFEKVSVFY